MPLRRVLWISLLLSLGIKGGVALVLHDLGSVQADSSAGPFSSGSSSSSSGPGKELASCERGGIIAKEGEDETSHFEEEVDETSSSVLFQRRTAYAHEKDRAGAHGRIW